MITSTPPPPDTSRAGKRAHPALLAAGGLLAGLLLTGGTLALWNHGGDAGLGQITAGNLGIELQGGTTWDETSPDVPAYHQHRDLDPTTFQARPGDTFRITQDFRTTLQGDNMRAQLNVTWDAGAAPSLPDSTSATYVVLDGDGAALTAPAVLGTPVVVGELAAEDDGRADDYTVQIDVQVDGPDRFGADAGATVAELGAIVVDLQQIRTGKGFQ